MAFLRFEVPRQIILIKKMLEIRTSRYVTRFSFAKELMGLLMQIAAANDQVFHDMRASQKNIHVQTWLIVAVVVFILLLGLMTIFSSLFL